MTGLDVVLRDLVAGAVREATAPLVAELRELRAAVGANSARWMSRVEAARTLGISLDTLDRRLRDRSLRSQRLGRAVRVLLEQPATEDKIAELATEARTSS